MTFHAVSGDYHTIRHDKQWSIRDKITSFQPVTPHTIQKTTFTIQGDTLYYLENVNHTVWLCSDANTRHWIPYQWNDSTLNNHRLFPLVMCASKTKVGDFYISHDNAFLHIRQCDSHVSIVNSWKWTQLWHRPTCVVVSECPLVVVFGSFDSTEIDLMQFHPEPVTKRVSLVSVETRIQSVCAGDKYKTLYLHMKNGLVFRFHFDTLDLYCVGYFYYWGQSSITVSENGLYLWALDEETNRRVEFPLLCRQKLLAWLHGVCPTVFYGILYKDVAGVVSDYLGVAAKETGKYPVIHSPNTLFSHQSVSSYYLFDVSSTST
jgi:hypothetical protein